MINSTELIAEWHRIGWNEPSKTGYTSILDTDNKTSDSGLKFDALHPLTNFVNIKDTYPDSAASNAVLNALLTDWQKSAILQTVTEVFNTTDSVQMGQFVTDIIDFDQTITGTSKFVGYKITVPYGSAITLKSVELLFNGVATFNLYVFNTSKLAAVTTKSVTSAANSLTLTAWDYTLYGSSTTLKSNVYYVGYLQSTVSPSAIQRDFFGVKGSCEVVPIEATPNGTSLPDDDYVSESGYTYGLNFEFVERKDFTPSYLNNLDLFDKAIGLSVICKALNQIHFSFRSNSSERLSKDGLNTLSAKAFLELNGNLENPNMPYTSGLLTEYKNEVKALREHFNVKSFSAMGIVGTIT
jgi:hypothetical protein